MSDDDRVEPIWSASWAAGVLYLTLGDRDGALSLLLVPGFPAAGVEQILRLFKLTRLEDLTPHLRAGAIVRGTPASTLCGFQGLAPE